MVIRWLGFVLIKRDRIRLIVMLHERTWDTQTKELSMRADFDEVQDYARQIVIPDENERILHNHTQIKFQTDVDIDIFRSRISFRGKEKFQSVRAWLRS